MKKFHFIALIVLFVFGTVSMAFAEGQSEAEEGELPKVTQNVRFLCAETNPDTINIIKKQISEFEKTNPGVKIEPEFISFQDVWRKIITGIQSGNPPDIVGIEDQQLFALQQEDMLVPVDDIIKKIGRERYFEIALECVSVNNVEYAIPYTLQTCATFYRADWYKEYGLDPPETWNDYLKAVKTLTRDTNGDGKIDQYGTNLPMGTSRYTPLIFWQWLWSNGGKIFDENSNVVLDKGEYLNRAVETLEFWNVVKDYGPPGITQYTWYEVLQGYYSGRLAHSEYAPRLMTELQRYNPQLISPKITQAVPTPRGPYGEQPVSYQIVKGWGIIKGSKNVDIAKDFIKFITTGKNYIQFAHTVPGHIMPPLRDVANSAEYLSHPLIMANPDVYKTFTDLVDNSVPFSRESGSIQYGSVGILDTPILTNMIQSVMIKNADPVEAVKKAAREIRSAGLGK